MKNIRHIKKHRPDRPTKFVRVDPRTIIETDIDTPNDLVIQRFNQHEQRNRQTLVNPPKTKGIDFFR